MKAFILHHHENNIDVYEARYVGTFGEAKDAAHEVPAALRGDIIVDEVEVQADKAGMLAALNGEPIIGEALRTWGITPRGALKEE